MTDKSFNLYKNTEKEWVVDTDNFVESSSLLFVCPIALTISLSVGEPVLITKPSANIVIACTITATSSITPTVTETNCYAGPGDCAGDDSGAFSSTGTQLYMGNVGGGLSTLGIAKSWIRFVVPLSSMTIESAILYIRSTGNYSSTTVKIKIGCEAADNPSAPTSWNDLNARALTSTYYSDNNVAGWTTGIEKSYDVTSSVQEILNRGGWVAGQTMAILIVDWGSSTGANRLFASSENITYNIPELIISYY